MRKAELIDHIHAAQNTLALCRVATYSSDWVIGLLSQIAHDVASLEPDEGDAGSIAPNFLPLDPENPHGCFHCQRAVFDTSINAYRCPHLGIEINKSDYVAPNDCIHWDSAWQNDHKQHKKIYLKP